MKESSARKKPLLIVISGPTAVGKTDLCIDLAQKLGCDILSTDSRQIYQEMAIGTAKPTVEEQAAAKHHMIDVRSIKEAPYSAWEFAQACRPIMERAFARGPYLIATGGSGLYIDAIARGLSNFPPLDYALRTQLENRAKKEGLSGILEDLAREDPLYYQMCDQKNARRLAHALAITRSGKHPYSYYCKQPLDELPYRVLSIGLTRPRDQLKARIKKRIDLMVQGGLIEEAAPLLPERARPALATIGYQELFPYFLGAYPLQESLDRIYFHTCQYAKRQMNYFKRNKAMAWFDPSDKAAICASIKAAS